MTGHRSVFPTQILALKKSSSVEVEVGKELDSVNTTFKFRDKSLIGLGFKILEKLKSTLKKK
jgi:hypothetical protein